MSSRRLLYILSVWANAKMLFVWREVRTELNQESAKEIIDLFHNSTYGLYWLDRF